MQGKEEEQSPNFFFPNTPKVRIHHSLVSDNVLFGIRIIGMTFLTGNYLAQMIIGKDSPIFSLIYLTKFGYFLSWLYFVSVVQARIITKVTLDRFVEALFEISFCFEAVITILYWVTLYEGGESPYDFYQNLAVHAVPLFLLFVDFIFNTYRFIASRVILVLIFAWIYLLIFSLPYVLAVGPVYGQFLTWKNAMSYVMIVGANVLILIFFFSGRAIFTHCKLKKLEQIKKNPEREGEASDMQIDPNN